MKTKRELLQNKLQQFLEEYNLYSAETKNNFLQNNHSLSGESSINFVVLGKQLIRDYFNGFTDSTETKIEAFNQIYLNYFKSTKQVSDNDLFEISTALEGYWKQWKIDLFAFLNQNYSDVEAAFDDSLFEVTFKPIISLESKRILNKLHELQIIFHIPFYKRFFAIFTPIAAAIGFLTGAIQFWSLINPSVINIKTVLFSFFK